ncbi:L-arabinose isomerase [Thermosipho sp. (in: thermotogales)]|jgi:L-arabinose isomerase|uniref:L-arabinose isomerase n=1 Tax=Thermosipho sp. (in: thermotogales) TaxID=1968895 RepID=UPI00257A11E1|nr:L-arabinose isomerase [Thermosipho sp. (in: thermotogales)]MBZ4649396.1 arabinose isomerase [Thermosipho sp. (in: thermotogales)]MDK2839484.1 L-arabinose isomerase [Thermosipho sp. (in: thermotogales)]
MIDIKKYEFWFLVGSQDLYGEETLKKVDLQANKIVESLNADPSIPGKIVLKPILKNQSEIAEVFEKANAESKCAGVIVWMHTFSPSKMWVRGLSINNKPLLHLHTQFNREIPWNEIDMDYMNLNQSAHGDREHGFIQTRMRLPRKVVVGHWTEKEVREKISKWMRVSSSIQDGRTGQIVRFGDNMREVASTEGDKIEAQIRFGWSVNSWGVCELAERIKYVPESKVNELMEEYKEKYVMPVDEYSINAIKEQARMEIAIKEFLVEKNAIAFTTTFEDLCSLPQLPGLAVQRLMEEGYGFGAEGDWKAAGLVRALKVMSVGLPGGTSFMEDYTYDLTHNNEKVLGSHMLEVCPSIAKQKPRIEVHPLSIGGKKDPARLVFEGKEGTALNASLVDIGDRFRLVVNKVISMEIEKQMLKLPTARVLWKPLPDFKKATTAWILAGGSHHTAFSLSLDTEYLEIWAELLNLEYLIIDENLNLENFKKELRWNDLYWKLQGK